MATSLSAILPPEMKALRLQPLFIFQLDVAKPDIVGNTPLCERRVTVITGGAFEGEKLRGKILTGGNDWQTVRGGDGTWMLDVRCVMQTDDGQLITMTYKGLRHGPKEVLDRMGRGEPVNASDYYLRVAPFFETASPKYAWLNNVVAVGTGHRLPTGPIYQVFEVL